MCLFRYVDCLLYGILPRLSSILLLCPLSWVNSSNILCRYGFACAKRWNSCLHLGQITITRRCRVAGELSFDISGLHPCKRPRGAPVATRYRNAATLRPGIDAEQVAVEMLHALRGRPAPQGTLPWGSGKLAHAVTSLSFGCILDLTWTLASCNSEATLRHSGLVRPRRSALSSSLNRSQSKVSANICSSVWQIIGYAR